MRDFEGIYELSGFTKLVSEIQQSIDHQANVLKAERANISALWERVTDNSASEILGLISDELGVMRKAQAETNRDMELQRRADGRQKFAEVKAAIDASVAGGLISGDEGYKLDTLIHRLARNIESY